MILNLHEKMAKAILTNREVKNKVTGVDIYVSDYQEVPHRIKDEFLYHVIVVSNLFYYKTRDHRESDVVQFMVSKTFDEFEDLYNKLYQRFPSVNFPTLPSKSSRSTNASGNLQCMDKVLKMVACTQKLSSSPMVISFLRGDSITTSKSKEKITVNGSKEEHTNGLMNGEHSSDLSNGLSVETPAENSNEFHDVDLFTLKPQEEVVEDVICAQTEQEVSSTNSIFDDECGSTGDTDADLFAITTDVKKNIYDKDYGLDDDLDLLGLSSDVDELMNLSKKSEKRASIKSHKPPPVKQRLSQTKETLGILNDAPNAKEDMFKRTKHKSFVRSHNHNNLDDIFGRSKNNPFLDVDDDIDLFSNSSKSKEAKKTGGNDINNTKEETTKTNESDIKNIKEDTNKIVESDTTNNKATEINHEVGETDRNIIDNIKEDIMKEDNIKEEAKKTDENVINLQEELRETYENYANNIHEGSKDMYENDLNHIKDEEVRETDENDIYNLQDEDRETNENYINKLNEQTDDSAVFSADSNLSE